MKVDHIEGKVLTLHDLLGELEATAQVGLDSFSDPEALAQFQVHIEELRRWEPNDDLPLPFCLHALATLIIAAYSVHGHSDFQRALGRPEADFTFDVGQSFLRKAVATMQAMMRQTAQEQFGCLSPEETGEMVN